LKRRGSVRRLQRMNNAAEELVQLMDFEEEG
jgi:hypothetical protein